MVDRIEIETLVRKIESSEISTDPFDYVYFDQFFPIDFYWEILDNLPNLKKYRQWRRADAVGPDGRSTRYRLFLYPEHLRTLPERQRRFWRHISSILYADTLQQAFKQKFRTALESRFGRGIDRMHFLPRAMLLRDLVGYSIAPHPDTHEKAITTQFYLPKDDTQQGLGTHLHYGNDDAPDARDIALPFRPACGYAFPVQKKSWHGVPTLRTNSGQRDSLLLNYYVPTRKLVFRLWQERFTAFKSILRSE